MAHGLVVRYKLIYERVERTLQTHPALWWLKKLEMKARAEMPATGESADIAHVECTRETKFPQNSLSLIIMKY